eukprot:5902350-Amphidinium_carterae.1
MFNLTLRCYSKVSCNQSERGQHSLNKSAQVVSIISNQYNGYHAVDCDHRNQQLESTIGPL